MVDAGDAAVDAERGRLQARQAGLATGSSLVVSGSTAWLVAADAPAWLVAGWLLASIAVVAVAAAGTHAMRRLDAAQAVAADRLGEIAAALAGLASGAAGTLFLPLIDPPARIAITLAACAGLAVAIVEVAHQGRPYRLQTACCLGQFALAWWRLDEAGAGLVAAALGVFGLLAAGASTVVDRLGRQALAASIENRRLAESLAGENARAVAADRAKTHFIAAASHDLRQPAAALSLIANLLRQQVTDPALAPAMRGLERSVHAMNDLLGQLLDLSRLDTGHVAVEPRRVDIDTLLDDLAREVEPQAAGRGLWLRVQHCGHELECDPVLLSRMLRNLVDNAMRHTVSGGITIAAQAGPRLALSVSDTGPGIAPEHQARIFDEHYQVGNASRQRANGLGLGLAIVRRIAALHDVAIGLDSRPGRGSRFTLTFRSAPHRPMPDRTAPSAPAGPAAGPPGFEGRMLLLVEDDDTLAAAFHAWLSAAGFGVRRAADATGALDALDSGQGFDVVVSDFRLPGPLDGLALLDRVGARRPAPVRILVSGDIDPALAERASEAGVLLLRKPFDPLQLRRVLSSSVG